MYTLERAAAWGAGRARPNARATIRTRDGSTKPHEMPSARKTEAAFHIRTNRFHVVHVTLTVTPKIENRKLFTRMPRKPED